MSEDREKLAHLIHRKGADGETPLPLRPDSCDTCRESLRTADLILDSDWLAEAKARAKAEALREFADECDGPDSSLHIMGAAQAAREHADRIEGEHHPDCYQVVGVPDDLPDDLCDCRVLRAHRGGH